MTREDCERLDAADPLAPLRARFALPPGVIYLDGNSLGALPRSTPARLAELVEAQWGGDLIAGWTRHGWSEAPRRVGAQIAPLIGAQPCEVVAADSTSVNLYKLASAALALRPDRSVIVAEAGDFPTDAYILDGLAQASGGRVSVRFAAGDALTGALDRDTALLCVSHVNYRTGALHDLAALAACAREAGALTLFDLSHSAGALPVRLDADGADLAVGCGYKYLNGGPGAPGFLFVAERLHGEIAPVIPGWFGHADPFAFAAAYAPASDAGRLLSGTPPVLGLAALEEGLRTFEGVDMVLVRAKSMALGRLFQHRVEARCADLGFAWNMPPDPARRGSQASLRHPLAGSIMADLARAGVVGDFRPPDVLRFGFTPLYTRHVDVFDAVERLAEAAAQTCDGRNAGPELDVGERAAP